MAKSKKKAKSFLPKKIAGVKVPKKVRQGRFGELLASPGGQKLIAEALLAAGAIAVGKKAAESPKVREMARDAKEKLADAGDGATHIVSDGGGALAFALAEAARTFTEAMRRGGPHEDRSFAANTGEGWTPESVSYEAAGAEDAAKKQPTAYEAGPL